MHADVFTAPLGIHPVRANFCYASYVIKTISHNEIIFKNSHFITFIGWHFYISFWI